MDAVCGEMLTAVGAMEERVLEAIKNGTQGPRMSFCKKDSESLQKATDADKASGRKLATDSPAAAFVVGPRTSLQHIHLQSARTTQESEEGERQPCGVRAFCAKVVDHPMFYGVVSIFIGLSVLVSVLEEEYAGYHANVSLGLAEPGAWEGAGACFSIARHAFNVVFLSEVVLCTSVKGIRYLKDPWGAFDALLVAANCIDVYVLQYLGGDSTQDFSVIRVVRCFRILRALGVSKKFAALQPVNLLLRTLTASRSALLWSLLLLGSVQLVGALFISRVVHGFITDTAQCYEDRLWVNRMYGSAMKSYWTFFEITFSGGWPNYVRPLLEKVGVGYAVFFSLYIGGWAFAALRIISALFIKETLVQSERDEDTHAQRKINEKKRLVRRFRRYFEQADASQDGQVDMDEFLKLFSNPEVQNWLEVHEIEVHDPRAMWQLMDKGNEDISITEFVDGLLRMRGPAKAQEMMSLMQRVSGVLAFCESIDAKLEGLLAPRTRGPSARPPDRQVSALPLEAVS